MSGKLPDGADDKGAFDQTDLVPEGKCNQWKEQQHNGAWKAKGKEAQLAEKRAEVEKQIGAMISTVQAHIENLVEAEKRKSEQYLSLARKYYTMWKALNDERSRRHRTLNKKKITPRRRDSTNAVSVLQEQNFTIPLAKTSMTMNKRFSENASSTDSFKIHGETLNISSM